MEWRRAWYEGSLRPQDWIDVDDAIDLRSTGNTKAGDTYCCQCKKVRISPVNSITRARHFRRHRKSPNEKISRKSCTHISKSESLGETWKHSQVVEEIRYYLENDGKDMHDVSRVESSKGVSHEEPDLIILHNKTPTNFSDKKTRILVRFFNWRRQREVISKYPNCIVIEAHRWQSTEINDNNFGDYIRKKVDRAYSMGPEERQTFLENFRHSTFFPNLGFWDEGLNKSNLQRKIEIKYNETDEKIIEELRLLGKLQERVKEHNMWSISVLGMHKYHLKNLKFEEFIGTSLHIDGVIDAMLSHGESINSKINNQIESKTKTNVPLKWGLKGIGKFSIVPIDVFTIAAEIPGLWEWEQLNDKQKKKCISTAKSKYYKSIAPHKSIPFCTTPLVNIGFNLTPRVLTDPNNILGFISTYIRESNEEFAPLTKEEFYQVEFYVSAERWMNGLTPHHPIYDSLIHDRVHSTDIYDKKQVISIPYSIHEKLIQKFGREPTETELKDILEKGIN